MIGRKIQFRMCGAFLNFLKMVTNELKIMETVRRLESMIILGLFELLQLLQDCNCYSYTFWLYQNLKLQLS